MTTTQSANLPAPLRPGLTPLEAAEDLLTEILAAREYAIRRRRAWSRWSIAIRLLAVSVSAGATVFLGLASTDGWGKAGFVLSALVTSLTALEPFFNWRSRWVGADEALARWYDIDDDLRQLVSSASPHTLLREDVDRQYRRYRKVWNDWSASWVAARQSTDS